MSKAGAFALVLALASFEGKAVTTFVDSTFNLTDYIASSYQYDLYSPNFANGTTQYSQTLTEGNPGKALQVDTVAQSAGAFIASSYFVNKTFSYDPSVSGAILTIDVRADLAKTFVTQQYTNPLVQLGLFLLAEQNGKYYAGTSVAFTGVAQGQFKTLSEFYNPVSLGFMREVVDFATLGENAFSTLNPSSGVIHFGIVVSNYLGGVQGFSTTDFVDNLSITVTPVPEVPTGGLMLVGGAVIAWVSRVRMRTNGRA